MQKVNNGPVGRFTRYFRTKKRPPTVKMKKKKKNAYEKKEIDSSGDLVSRFPIFDRPSQQRQPVSFEQLADRPVLRNTAKT